MENLLIASALTEATATPAPEPAWLQTALEHFGEINLTGWIALAVLLVLGVGILYLTRGKTKWTANLLAYAALSIALAFVLSLIRLWHLPQGGSVTPASMLPILLFAYAFGPGPGLTAAVAYGLLQAIQDPWIVSPWQFLLDYPLAFGVLGLAGLFKAIKSQAGLYIGIAVAALLRMACHVVSGVVFFASYAAEANMPVWSYSIAYNSFVLVDAAICLALALLVSPRILKLMKAR